MNKPVNTIKTVLKCILAVAGLGIAFAVISNGNYPMQSSYSGTSKYKAEVELKNPSIDRDVISAYIAEKYPTMTLQTVAPSPTPAQKSFTANQPVTDNTRQKEHTFLANKNTKVYHRPSCSDINKMKETNKIHFTCTAEEMRKKGYRPCQHCYPDKWQ